MVKNISKILSLLLILAVFVSNIHIVSFANDYSTEGYTTNIYEFADEVREVMTQREREYVIKYKSKVLYTQQNQDDFTQIITNLIELAYQETDKPNQGDYLKYVLSKYGYALSGFGYGEYYYYTVELNIYYYTTANQEEQLALEIQNVIESFNFTNSTTDKQKCDAIYNYITENIRYDNENLYDDEYLLKYTAYAALINKTAVCQGYATLFYRMAKECGLDVRVISGTSRGEGHAWNIVKLENWYYYLDSTWDEGRKNYRYYLKGSNDFDDHENDKYFNTAEFKAAHPINVLNYVEFHEHDYSTPATCTLPVTCSLCGKNKPGSVALDHSFIDYVFNKDATCVLDGTKTAVCSRDGCDETKTITAVSTFLGHSFTNYIYNEDATCTEDGTKTAKCDRCDKTDTQVASGTMRSHRFKNYVFDNNATCTQDGTKTAKCDYGCGETDTVLYENSKLSHNFIDGTCNNCGFDNCDISGVHKYAEPTCDKPGICYLCNNAVNPEKSEVLGHDYQDYKPDDFATCERNATKTSKCSHCDLVDTKEVEGTILGHKFENYKYDVGTAKCQLDGTKTAKCERCDQTKTITAEGTALQHEFVNHKYNNDASCTKDGTKTAVCSNGCGEKETVTATGTKLAHKEITVLNSKSTLTTNGTLTTKCSVCGTPLKTIVIAKIGSVTTTEKVTYNGKTKTPAVIVKDANGKVISSSNYTVSYAKGRKNYGKYKITVTFKGNYSSSKAIYFEIVPKGTKVSKLTAQKKSLKVKISKQKSASGYQIQYSLNKNFKSAKTVTLKKNSLTSKTISKLKPKKTYYVRVRTYKTYKGKKYYSAWSSLKVKKTK